jgi:hypothetical protein
VLDQQRADVVVFRRVHADRPEHRRERELDQLLGPQDDVGMVAVGIFASSTRSWKRGLATSTSA